MGLSAETKQKYQLYHSIQVQYRNPYGTGVLQSMANEQCGIGAAFEALTF
jgi:hypothetical protein